MDTPGSTGTGGARSSSTHASKRSPEVDDALERLLIKLNRQKYGASHKQQSMTMVAAMDALDVFRTMLEREGARSVSGVISRITRICQQSFSRAPSFRLVLANVTRLVLLGIREAAASESEAALRRAHEEDATDLSAMANDGSGWHEDDEDGNNYPTSPRAGMPQRSVSFSAYAHGFFPRMPTNEEAEDGRSPSEVSPAADGAAPGRQEEEAMGETMPSNSSFMDRPPTPLTEATIPRIPSHFAGVRYHRHANYDKFRERALKAMEDIGDTMANMMDSLCSHAVDHIADGDTVLTFGSCHTIMRFLSVAAKEGTKFRVIALAADPHGNAEVLKAALAPFGVPVEIVPDSECYNVVPRCSKVFLSTEGVLANGGLLAPTGSHMICIVARVFAVDIVVVATTIKISPYYPSDSACSSLVKLSTNEAKEMLWSTFADPAHVLPHEHVHSVVPSNGMDSPLVFNPTVEYVPPEHVSIFVTDSGEFTPAFINRFLREQYHPEDTHL